MNSKLTSVRKNKLIKDFGKITSIEEKFSFWKKEFQTNYIEYLLFCSESSYFSNNLKFKKDLNFYKKFEIKIDGQEENISIISDKIYESCFEYDNLINQEMPILTLEKLIKDFEFEFFGITNKKPFLEMKINELKSIISNLEKIKLFRCSEFFTMGYKISYYENTFYQILSQVDVFKNISHRNGYAIGQYHLFLEDIISDPSTYSNKVSKRLRIEQQLLILYYLGVFEKLSKLKYKYTQEEFLALLVGKTYQNVKTIFSAIQLHRDSRRPSDDLINDLSIVKSLFDTVNFKAESEEIEKTLIKYTHDKKSSS